MSGSCEGLGQMGLHQVVGWSLLLKSEEEQY